MLIWINFSFQVYCMPDYHSLFAPRCASCTNPILPDPKTGETIRVVAINNDYHVECYTCEVSTHSNQTKSYTSYEKKYLGSSWLSWNAFYSGLFYSSGRWLEQQMLSTRKTSSLLWLPSTMEKNRRRNATNHWSLISLSPAPSQSHTHHISLIVTNNAHHYSSPLFILLYAFELALVSAVYIDRYKVPLSSLSNSNLLQLCTQSKYRFYSTRFLSQFTFIIHSIISIFLITTRLQYKW